MESDAFTEPQARRAARRAIVERVVTGRMNGDEIPGVKELMRNLREGCVRIAGQAFAGHADRHGTAMLEGVVGAVLNQKVVLACGGRALPKMSSAAPVSPRISA